jgi:hypothetical protein
MHDRIEEYARRSDTIATAVWCHASSFGPTSSLRQNQGYFRESRRLYWLHQTPNAKRCMFLSPSTSVRYLMY